MRLTKAFRAAMVAIGFCAAAALPASAAEMDHVILAIPAPSFSFTMEFVAQDAGLFAKQGIAVKEMNIAGLGSINALIAGSVDFALASGASLTRAAARGQRLLAIAGLSDKPFVQIVMRKDVAQQAGFDPKAPLAARAKLLKGHTWGVDSINAVNDAYLRLVAKLGGIDPDSLKIAVISPPSLPAAFETKQIDGFAMTPPWPQKVLVDGNAVLLASGPDGDPANLAVMNNSVLLTRDQVCQKRPQVCEKVGQAYAAAAKIIRDDPKEAIAVLEKRFPHLGAKTVTAAFDVLQKITPVPPAATLQGVKSNETFNVMAGLMRPSEALKNYDGLFTDKYVK
jgi:sulfonate transport system substrate-binding protein